MNKRYNIGIILLLLTMSACSNKQIYNAIQYNQRTECEKLPPVQYEECIKDYEESYEDYKNNREDILKDSDKDPEPGASNRPQSIT